MRKVDRKILLNCVRHILKSLVRFSLRHSLTVQDIEDCLRRVFVECAKETLESEQQEVSLSRLSVMTGLNRRQIQQVEKLDDGKIGTPSLLIKVVGQWQTDKKFLDSKRSPRILSFGSEKSEFNALVKKVSTDLNPAAVLFELERNQAVERVDGGLKLVVQSFKPRGDVEAGFRVLGQDMRDLIHIVEENLLDTPSIGNLHLRTEYDRVRPEGIVNLQQWLLVEGNAFHDRARREIAKYDQDVTPDPNFVGQGTRIVLNSFGKVFEEGEKHE